MATYLVTAKHVIAHIKLNTIDGHVYIRCNTNDGKTGTAQTDVVDWKYHEDSSVDVALIQWDPDSTLVDFRCVGAEMAVTSRIIEEEGIGAGDEVFLTGLFSQHVGTTRNLPIIRTGNIAMMPEEKVITNTFGAIDAYLIEARSIGGLSGSPVFAYLGHVRPNQDSLVVGSPGGSSYGWV